MLVTSSTNTANSTTTTATSSSTPTPGSISSSSNTLEPSLYQQQQEFLQSSNQQINYNNNNNINNNNNNCNSNGNSNINGYNSNSNSNVNNNSRPPSRALSILDSPTLARVERARLRLEASSQQQQQQQQQQLQHHQQLHQPGQRSSFSLFSSNHFHHQHNNNLNNNNNSNVNINNNSNNSIYGSATTTLNRDDSLERSILDPKKEAPWHQVWTHMKRLSHASKVNSTTTTLTAQKTDHGPGKFMFYPDKTASLKDAFQAQQIYFRPDMQSLLAGRLPIASMTGPIKRGLLWQQRDRLFSRWKERYFVLTRDYLHCFKRASGSANERASDMGQFIFKVKLVDVEKVEWINRRSYSAIGLLLGREGRVLLRCEDGLEDWFELLEECTLISKERRRALKIAQGPRSRASLAAPVSHSSLQSNHFGLGSTYTSALDDWLMTNGSGMGGRHKIGTGGATNPFLFSDSVPDLSAINNENQNHISGLSTNHSTPQKIPYSAANNMNGSRYSNGYASQNNSFTNCTGLYGSPRRIFINSNFGSNQIVDEEAEDGEVELRRPRHSYNNNTENGNELDRDWLYRKPRAPTDMRHSVQPMLPVNNNNSSSNLHAGSDKSSKTAASTATANFSKIITDLDHSAHDSGLDTPPSTTQRPSSYRESPSFHHATAAQRDSTETNASSSRGTLLNASPRGSFRSKHLNNILNLNQVNALHGSRYSVQEQRILKIRNEEDRCASIRSSSNTRLHPNELYDPNQNRHYKNINHSPSLTPQHTPSKLHHPAVRAYQNNSANGNNGALTSASNATNNNNNNINYHGSPLNNGNHHFINGSVIFRERYQHPALQAIINESQGIKFRDRSYSDCQQMPTRRSVNNNPSPLAVRRNQTGAIFGTPTRV